MASRIPTSLFTLALVVSFAALLGACSDRRPVSSDLGPGLAADLAPDLRTSAPDLHPPAPDLAPDLCVPTGRYPLKVVFLVDTSGSMKFTDPSNKAADAVQRCLATCKQIGGLDCEALCKHNGLPGRQAAVQQVVGHLKSYADVTLSIIAFDATIQVSGGKSEQLLAPGAAGLSDALLMLQRADLSTDYQSALSAAKRVIEQDALAEDVATRGRSKYVIVLLTDGMPSPRCQLGCGNDTLDVGVKIDNWCDVERPKWCKHFNNFGPPNCDMVSWFPAMSAPCLAYNSEVQLLQLVDEIALLETTHGVGEIRLHTALVFDSTLPKSIRDLIYDPTLTPKQQSAEIELLLKNLAKAGGGVYWRFDSGQSIDFLGAQHPQVFTPLDPCAP